MYRILALLAAVVLVLSTPAALNAQPLPDASPAPRAYAGGYLSFAQPEGEFRDYVQRGFGLGAHGIVRLDGAGLLGLRIDAGYVNYGRETKRVALSPTIGDRIQVDVSTTNNIATIGVGPQLMLPDGRLRPYVNATLGASYFFTQSSVEGTQGAQPFAQTTNYDDLTFSYGGGGGLYVPVRRGAPVVSLDIGARYLVNGETRYLREGSIRDLPGGEIELLPIRSETNFFTFHVGVSVGLPEPGRAGRGRRARD